MVVAFAPFELEPGLAYGALRQGFLVPAVDATWGNESTCPPDNSVFSRLVFSSPILPCVYWPVAEVVVVETFVFGVVSAACNNLDIAKV